MINQSDSLWTVVVEYEGIKSVPFHLGGRKQEDKTGKEGSSHSAYFSSHHSFSFRT